MPDFGSLAGMILGGTGGGKADVGAGKADVGAGKGGPGMPGMPM